MARPASSGLTPRQQVVLNEIIRLTGERFCPPTLRELMEATGITSNNGIRGHLKSLEAKGFIALERGSRGIRLLHADAKAVVCLHYLTDLAAYQPRYERALKELEDALP